MTRISFYLLQDAQPQARLLTACRLAEKAYQAGSQLYVHTTDDAQTQQLDQLLWTFRQGSFIPHERADQDDETSPILIGHAPQPPLRINDVLLNLAAEVPVFFSRFGRVLEIVGSQAEEREQARVRFRFYRDRGYELETHELGA